jgi:hypothetical protein
MTTIPISPVDALVPAPAPSPAPAPAPSAVSSPTSKPLKYFPAPPIVPSYFQYQNVNADKNLQNTITLEFLADAQKWFKNDKSFKKLKKYSKQLNGQQGYEIIHKLLKLFVKRGNTNWYDLSMQKSLVKDFIKYKLSNL